MASLHQNPPEIRQASPAAPKKPRILWCLVAFQEVTVSWADSSAWDVVACLLDLPVSEMSSCFSCTDPARETKRAECQIALFGVWMKPVPGVY